MLGFPCMLCDVACWGGHEDANGVMATNARMGFKPRMHE